MTFFIYSRLQHTPRASGQRVKNCHITYEYTVKKETEASARGPSCTVYYVYFRGLPWNLSKFWGIPRSISKSWNVSKYTYTNILFTTWSPRLPSLFTVYHSDIAEIEITILVTESVSMTVKLLVRLQVGCSLNWRCLLQHSQHKHILCLPLEN